MFGRGKFGFGNGKGNLGFESLESRLVMSGTNATATAPAVEESVAVQTSAPILSTIEWVQSLSYWQLGQLAPAQVPYLTGGQIASIPAASYLNEMSPQARAALSQAQVRALNISAVGIGLLTQTQISWLTTAQVQQVPYYQFHLLYPHQIPSLTSAQVASIPGTSYLAEWSSASVAALTQPQVRSLNTSVVAISLLTDQQVSWLTVNQIQRLSFYDFARLKPAQISYMTPSQIASIPRTSYLAEWPPESISALAWIQVRALNTSTISISLLDAAQVGWLTAAQVQQLNYIDFAQLHPGQIPSLTTAQVSTIPGTHLAQWSPAARAALTQPQVRALNADSVPISLLTDQQIGWLTTAQVQKTHYAHFARLQPGQIPQLTVAQIASIPATSYFAEWPTASVAALTFAQVRAIDTAKIQLTTKIRAGDFDGDGVVDRRDLTKWRQHYGNMSGGDFLAWQRDLGATRSLLTPLQVSWLTADQIQRLQYYDFRHLTPSQIPYLTPAQIASVPSASYFAEWPADARARLTYVQIRSIDTGSVSIRPFTAEQISWLTAAQVQQVRYDEFELLAPNQIPLITLQQLKAMPSINYLVHLPDASRAALTRKQILSLPYDMLATFTFTEPEQTPPSGYVPTVDIPIGPDGIAVSHHGQMEAEKAFALVPVSAATHVAIASGNWSDPQIWQGGKTPTAGARVYIPRWLTVQFDAYLNSAIKTLRIDGTLSFAADRNTQLKADTIVVYTTGALHIGTATNPIQDHVTARILIADNGPIDRVWDPWEFSRGIVSEGEVRMYGKEVTPYVALAKAPSAGDTTLQLSQVPTNWKVGDVLVVAGTDSMQLKGGSDQVVIRAINGSIVTVDPLAYNHHPPAGQGLAVHVANLSRNVVLAAEDSSVVAERPHVAFMHNPNVIIKNIAVDGFGRTDKSRPINDPVVVNGVLQPGTGTNVRARYALHFHHTGVNPARAPAQVSGSVVIGSGGWGYVNHQSNVVFDHNVAYGVAGSAFVTEDGNEIGVMRGNLALGSTGAAGTIASRREIHDYGFAGHGFWLQGPGVKLIDNIAAGNVSAGFTYFTSSGNALMDVVNLNDPALGAGYKVAPVNTVPLAQNSGNVSYGSGVGLDIWFHMTSMTDGQTVIDKFTSWNTRNAGIGLHYAGRVTIKDAKLFGSMAEPSGVGVLTNRFTHDVTLLNLQAEGFQTGVEVPLLGATVIEGGRFAAVQALLIKKGHNTLRTVDVRGAVVFAPLTAAQLDGRTQYSVVMSGSYDFFASPTNLEALLHADRVVLAITGLPKRQLYYFEQLGQYVPFPAGTNDPAVPFGYLGKRNDELALFHGVAFGGESIGVGTTYSVPGISALVRTIV